MYKVILHRTRSGASALRSHPFIDERTVHNALQSSLPDLHRISPSPHSLFSNSPPPVLPNHLPNSRISPNSSLENLAVRPNNQVLVNFLNEPSLCLSDPAHPTHATFIHSFVPATALTGITESTPDVFYLAAGTYDAATRTLSNGSFDIWEIDFTSPIHPSASPSRTNSKPKIEKVAHLSTASLPNGLATLSARYILVADSAVGAVFRVDASTGKSQIVIQDPTMAPTPVAPFGVNGLRIRGGCLYYTNSDTSALVRITIQLKGEKTGMAREKAEVLSTDFELRDDIEVGTEEVYVTENGGSKVSVFNLKDKVKKVLASKESSGGLTVGSTSVRLARREERQEGLVCNDEWRSRE